MQGEQISGPSNMRILVLFDQSKCFIVLVEPFLPSRRWAARRFIRFRRVCLRLLAPPLHFLHLSPVIVWSSPPVSAFHPVLQSAPFSEKLPASARLKGLYIVVEIQGELIWWGQAEASDHCSSITSDTAHWANSGIKREKIGAVAAGIILNYGSLCHVLML